jgi:hypothetical protein
VPGAPEGMCTVQPYLFDSRFYLLYLSPSFLWWQGVAGMIRFTSSTALRRHSRCTWRPREGARNVYRSISHMLSFVKSGGGAVYFLSNAGLIACKDEGLCEAFSCPWPPSSPFYKLL